MLNYNPLLKYPFEKCCEFNYECRSCRAGGVSLFDPADSDQVSPTPHCHTRVSHLHPDTANTPNLYCKRKKKKYTKTQIEKENVLFLKAQACQTPKPYKS